MANDTLLSVLERDVDAEVAAILAAAGDRPLEQPHGDGPGAVSERLGCRPAQGRHHPAVAGVGRLEQMGRHHTGPRALPVEEAGGGGMGGGAFPILR